ncbi:hypothetical protein GLOIN_2v1773137 [Rhizophagus clarus]|uniref:Uncharacterized protein n=1 Tax=Rhizophagus clarus TaxID=94130 RepID=A0A8H3QPQ8_9GLOM|nr:hypothetical protein GLOIN_2v1773137 [Rhizophagus clarus]
MVVVEAAMKAVVKAVVEAVVEVIVAIANDSKAVIICILTILFHLEETYNALDDDEELKQCIRKLKRRFGIRSVIIDSNEAMRCE